MAIFFVTLVHTGIAGPLVWVGDRGGVGLGTKKMGGGSLSGTKKWDFGRAAAEIFGFGGPQCDSGSFGGRKREREVEIFRAPAARAATEQRRFFSVLEPKN